MTPSLWKAVLCFLNKHCNTEALLVFCLVFVCILNFEHLHTVDSKPKSTLFVFFCNNIYLLFSLFSFSSIFIFRNSFLKTRFAFTVFWKLEWDKSSGLNSYGLVNMHIS